VWRGIVGAGAERLVLAPGRPPQAAHERRPIRKRVPPKGGSIAMVSRSHLDRETEAYLDRLQIAHRIACGSALKFCLLAEGQADIYPRLSTTAEWDVAAGDAVLTAAGGTVTAPDGAPLAYGRPGYRIPAFIASGESDRTAAP
jgi:3'-phosphoadenosine 5'-phosphosulfate (PAPS) 3'-phosphatase